MDLRFNYRHASVVGYDKRSWTASCISDRAGACTLVQEYDNMYLQAVANFGLANTKGVNR